MLDYTIKGFMGSKLLKPILEPQEGFKFHDRFIHGKSLIYSLNNYTMLKFVRFHVIKKAFSDSVISKYLGPEKGFDSQYIYLGKCFIFSYIP